MAPLVELALTAVAFIGHFPIAVWLFNRLHAVALPRRSIKVLEKLLLLTAAGIVAVGCLGFAQQNTGWQAYLFICWLAAAAVVPCWLIPKLRERTPAALLANDTTLVDVAQRLGFRPVHGAEAQFFARIPGNELLRIAVQRKTLRLPNLPSQLDGLTIAHISDLHMTGQLGREFYDCIVDESNALSPDLVVITGDILEKERCLPLIKPTLGRLQARHGKQFILGNHFRGEVWGAELSVSYQATGWWRLQGSYGYIHKNLWPTSASATPSVREGDDPRNQFSIQSIMDLPAHFQFDMTARYVDTLPSPSVPSYFTFDVRIAKQFKNLEFSIVGQNLFEDRHPEFGAASSRQEIQRGVYGKVVCRF